MIRAVIFTLLALSVRATNYGHSSYLSGIPSYSYSSYSPSSVYGSGLFGSLYGSGHTYGSGHHGYGTYGSGHHGYGTYGSGLHHGSGITYASGLGHKYGSGLHYGLGGAHTYHGGHHARYDYKNPSRAVLGGGQIISNAPGKMEFIMGGVGQKAQLGAIAGYGKPAVTKYAPRVPYSSGAMLGGGFFANEAPAKMEFVLGGTGFKTGAAALGGHGKPAIHKYAPITPHSTGSILSSGVLANDAPGKIEFVLGDSGYKTGSAAISGQTKPILPKSSPAFRRIGQTPKYGVPITDPHAAHIAFNQDFSGISRLSDISGIGAPKQQNINLNKAAGFFTKPAIGGPQRSGLRAAGGLAHSSAHGQAGGLSHSSAHGQAGGLVHSSAHGQAGGLAHSFAHGQAGGVSHSSVYGQAGGLSHSSVQGQAGFSPVQPAINTWSGEAFAPKYTPRVPSYGSRAMKAGGYFSHEAPAKIEFVLGGTGYKTGVATLQGHNQLPSIHSAGMYGAARGQSAISARRPAIRPFPKVSSPITGAALTSHGSGFDAASLHSAGISGVSAIGGHENIHSSHGIAGVAGLQSAGVIPAAPGITAGGAIKPAIGGPQRSGLRAAGGLTHSSAHGQSGGLSHSSAHGQAGGLAHSSAHGQAGGLAHSSVYGQSGGLSHSSAHGRGVGLEHSSAHGQTGGLSHSSAHGQSGGLSHSSAHGQAGGLAHSSVYGQTRGLTHSSAHGQAGGLAHSSVQGQVGFSPVRPAINAWSGAVGAPKPLTGNIHRANLIRKSGAHGLTSGAAAGPHMTFNMGQAGLSKPGMHVASFDKISTSHGSGLDAASLHSAGIGRVSAIGGHENILSAHGIAGLSGIHSSGAIPAPPALTAGGAFKPSTGNIHRANWIRKSGAHSLTSGVAAGPHMSFNMGQAAPRKPAVATSHRSGFDAASLHSAGISGISAIGGHENILSAHDIAGLSGLHSSGFIPGAPALTTGGAIRPFAHNAARRYNLLYKSGAHGLTSGVTGPQISFNMGQAAIRKPGMNVASLEKRIAPATGSRPISSSGIRGVSANIPAYGSSGLAGPAGISFIQDFSKAIGSQTAGVQPTLRNTAGFFSSSVAKPLPGALAYRAPKQPGSGSTSLAGSVSQGGSIFASGPAINAAEGHAMDFKQGIAGLSEQVGGRLSSFEIAPESGVAHFDKSSVLTHSTAGGAITGGIVSGVQHSSTGIRSGSLHGRDESLSRMSGDKTSLFNGGAAGDKSTFHFHSTGVTGTSNLLGDKGSIVELVPGGINTDFSGQGMTLGRSGVFPAFPNFPSSSHSGFSQIAREYADKSLFYSAGAPNLVN